MWRFDSLNCTQFTPLWYSIPVYCIYCIAYIDFALSTLFYLIFFPFYDVHYCIKVCLRSQFSIILSIIFPFLFRFCALSFSLISMSNTLCFFSVFNFPSSILFWCWFAFLFFIVSKIVGWNRNKKMEHKNKSDEQWVKCKVRQYENIVRFYRLVLFMMISSFGKWIEYCGLLFARVSNST